MSPPDEDADLASPTYEDASLQAVRERGGLRVNEPQIKMLLAENAYLAEALRLTTALLHEERPLLAQLPELLADHARVTFFAENWELLAEGDWPDMPEPDDPEIIKDFRRTADCFITFLKAQLAT